MFSKTRLSSIVAIDFATKKGNNSSHFYVRLTMNCSSQGLYTCRAEDLNFHEKCARNLEVIVSYHFTLFGMPTCFDRSPVVLL